MTTSPRPRSWLRLVALLAVVSVPAVPASAVSGALLPGRDAVARSGAAASDVADRSGTSTRTEPSTRTPWTPSRRTFWRHDQPSCVVPVGEPRVPAAGAPLVVPDHCPARPPVRSCVVPAAEQERLPALEPCPEPRAEPWGRLVPAAR